MTIPTQTYSVTPSQLMGLINHFTSRKASDGRPKGMMAPFIWGGPGIGKTDIVRSLAKSRKSRIVALHLPQMDPTDLKGIPVMQDGIVRWMPSSYLPQQQRVRVNSSEHLSMTVDWEYAIDLAVYVYDRDGNEIASYSDPVADDYGDVNVRIAKTGLTTWGVSATLPVDAYEMVIVDKAIVFLDELSAAEPSTQNAALQLVLDRRVGEYDMPIGVPVIAAGNRETDGAFVQTLSHPLCNRFVHITLVPSVDDFVDWGMAHNIRPEVLGYVKAYPDAIYLYEPDALTNGNYGFPTPRTLAFLSDQYEPLSVFEQMAGESSTGDAAERLRLTAFAGIIGQTEASRFIGYLTIMHSLPSVQDIIAGRAAPIGRVERSKTFGLLFSLVQNLKHYHTKFYDDSRAFDDQDDNWTNSRDRIITYITDNFEKESGTWAGFVIFNKLGITPKALRSDAMLAFSQKYLSTMTSIGRVR